MKKVKAEFFSKEMSEKIYYISCKEWEEPTSSTNCWLVVGDEKALLIDAGFMTIGLKAYAEKLAECPVILALSHGHFDHVGAVDEFNEFMIHPADLKLLEGGQGMPKTEYEGTPVFIYSGDTIELGNRELKIYGIKGHTEGSLVFLDLKTKTLFSGDSVARRGLFLTPEELPISQYFDDLLEIEKLDFEQVASAHDRFFLDKGQIRYFITTVIDEIQLLDDSCKTWSMPDGLELISIHAGKGFEDPEYITCSIPKKNYKEQREQLLEWKKRNKNWWNK